MLRSLYRITGAGVHLLLLILSPLLRKMTPELDIEKRLGNIAVTRHAEKRPLIWMHAASVGEVQAAKALINGLLARKVDADCLLTTMTRQGREVAQLQLPDIACYLAPLDTPQAVAKAVHTIAPQLYICLETELWPALLEKLDNAGVPRLLLNGRMSARSCKRYRFIAGTMARLLGNFSGIGVISKQDAERYRSFAAFQKIRVCGNIKYAPGQSDPEKQKDKYTRLLQLDKTTVFICGSTRTGEEELLLPVYKQLAEQSEKPVVWIIAPRHLERLPAVEKLLRDAGLDYDLFSRCQGRPRSAEIILVDVMGRLAELYAAGEFIFCGGSLVEKGGHNIMEPVLMNRPVHFGSSMADFADAAALVLGAKAGFQVATARDLAGIFSAHLQDPEQYKEVCQMAETLARTQRDAVKQQTGMVMELLAG